MRQPHQKFEQLFPFSETLKKVCEKSFQMLRSKIDEIKQKIVNCLSHNNNKNIVTLWTSQQSLWSKSGLKTIIIDM